MQHVIVEFQSSLEHKIIIHVYNFTTLKIWKLDLMFTKLDTINIL